MCIPTLYDIATLFSTDVVFTSALFKFLFVCFHILTKTWLLRLLKYCQSNMYEKFVFVTEDISSYVFELFNSLLLPIETFDHFSTILLVFPY